MESGLSHAGNRIGVIDPVEVGHGLGIIECDRTIVVRHRKHVTIFRVVHRHDISI